MTTSEVCFCPQCCSAAVDYSGLVGAQASCRGCGWYGEKIDLLSVPVQHTFLTDESMVLGMVNELRQLLAGELGVPYLRFLLKWGFVKADPERLAQTVDRKEYARYISAIAGGIMESLVKTRARIAEAGASAESRH